MKAEIISVGTELLLGHTVNTDAAFVARELSALGVDLLFAGTVGDNPERLESCLRAALERSDLVITTGGLGPTDDDLTKQTVARVLETPLQMHEESLRRLERHFQGRGMGETQRRQAMLPAGCTVFVNNAGTAPGCAVASADGRIVIMLPGPPSELLAMLRDSVVPYLKERTHAAISSAMVRTFGIGEGAAAERLVDLAEQANPSVATYAADCEMFVRVTAKAADESSARALVDPVVAEVRRRLGDVVYGVDVDNLESVVVAGLIRRKLSLATAESCTGGLVAKRITDVAGASDVFGAGVITYANEAKIRLLGVSGEMLAAHGAVSPQVAGAMAEGARKRQGADLGIGITGVAGPGGGTPDKPVGLVYIALSSAGQTWIRTMKPLFRTDDRARIRLRASGTALDMVRRYLEDLPVLPE